MGPNRRKCSRGLRGHEYASLFRSLRLFGRKGLQQIRAVVPRRVDPWADPRCPQDGFAGRRKLGRPGWGRGSRMARCLAAGSECRTHARWLQRAGNWRNGRTYARLLWFPIALGAKRVPGQRRSFHQHEPRPVEMLNEALGRDPGHKLVAVMYAPAPIVAERESQCVLQLFGAGRVQFALGHGPRLRVGENESRTRLGLARISQRN